MNCVSKNGMVVCTALTLGQVCGVYFLFRPEGLFFHFLNKKSASAVFRAGLWRGVFQKMALCGGHHSLEGR